MRNRIRYWESWRFRYLQRCIGFVLPRTQSVSRTGLLQHRFRDRQEHEDSALGERYPRHRLPIFQLFQPSKFWISRYRGRNANGPDHIPRTAANKHPGHWDWLGANRRGSENGSVEGGAEVLTPNSLYACCSSEVFQHPHVCGLLRIGDCYTTPVGRRHAIA